MDVEQMVWHVGLAYRGALGEFPMAPDHRGPEELVKVMALWSPLPWPKGVKTVPELEEAIAEGSAAAFSVVQAAALDGARRVAAGAGLVERHPMMGAMTVKDWHRWGFLHADHHLRQFGR